MKNKFKLLALAVCGALYVGESYADENFTTPIGTYSLGYPYPSFVDIEAAVADWAYRHELVYQNCLITVQERQLDQYGCMETIFHDLRPVDGVRLINGNWEQYVISRTTINHLVAKDPATGETITNDIISPVGTNVFSLTNECPAGTSSRVFNVTSESFDLYCRLPDLAVDNSSSVGNPINYISRQKNDLTNDFLGRDGLALTRYYINQNEGWVLRDTSKLVDLYHVELGQPVSVDFKTTVSQRRISIENTEQNIIENGVAIISSPISYVTPDESNRKVLVADEHGITQSYFGGPTIFRSVVDSSLLIYSPDQVEVDAPWKLVNTEGVQRFFNDTGDVKEIRYPNGDIIFYQYDEQGRVIRKDNKFGDYIAYEYDGSGNTVKATVMPENIMFDYIYETIETGTYPDRLIEVKQDQVVTLRYQYDDLAYPLAMTSVTDANDIVLARWAYNSKGEAILTSPDNINVFNLSFSGSVNAPLSLNGSESFIGYGPEITNPDGSKTFHALQRIAGYDRVIATVDRSIDGTSVQAEFYTYDILGNINTLTSKNRDVTYKVYDENRFLVSESTGYRWSNEFIRYGTYSNPLPFLVGTEIETTNFCWDSNTGLRTKIITDDLVTTFIYSELGQIINTFEEPANSTNNTCN